MQEEFDLIEQHYRGQIRNLDNEIKLLREIQ
mgnify:CR=1 FL=1